MTTGLIWGKFMPVHRGHMHLIDHARGCVDRLTVLVCSRRREPIPGRLRFEWVRDLYSDVDVQHCMDEVPSYPDEHPDFWNIWLPILRRFVPAGPDYFFSSEMYGDHLARLLGARHICVDLERRAVPISGTAIRANPRAHWNLLPPAVQAYYQQLLTA